MRHRKLIATLLACALALTACGQSAEKKETESSASASSTETKSEQSSEAKSGESSEAKAESSQQEKAADEVKGVEVTLHRSYETPHGKKSFARVAVAVADGKIVAATIDEFQYLPAKDVKGVPGSDGKFGEGAKEGFVLASKTENDEYYSNLMKDKAKATKTIVENYKAICDFCIGKTPDEIAAVAEGAEKGKPIDAVSGATLADTAGYLMAIVNCAKNDSFVSTGTAADTAALRLVSGFGQPHGKKSFGDAVVLKDGDKIVCASIDEFLYYKGTGVPNSDKGFGKNYAKEDAPLCSKLVNNEAYSAHMTEKAKATKTIAENYKAIEAFCAGKTAAEIEEVASKAEKGKPVDAVSGATLADTAGYLKLVVDAAN